MPAETRLVVFGAAGRLGSRIVSLAAQTPGMRVVQARVSNQSPHLKKSVPDHPALQFESDDAPLPANTVAVDVSLAHAADAHVRLCADAGVPLLLAVTGLQPGTLTLVQQLSARVAMCVAPNLSTGVWVMAHLVKQAAHQLDDFDVELTETHHRNKKDAPSGTGIMLAQHVAAGRQKGWDHVKVLDRTDHPGVRTPGTIGMTSLRGGDVVGDHTVFFLGDGERVELTHRAHSRDVFARGALRLAPKLATASPGLLTVPHLLGLT